MTVTQTRDWSLAQTLWLDDDIHVDKPRGQKFEVERKTIKKSYNNFWIVIEADCESRTRDPLLTKQMQ